MLSQKRSLYLLPLRGGAPFFPSPKGISKEKLGLGCVISFLVVHVRRVEVMHFQIYDGDGLRREKRMEKERE